MQLLNRMLRKFVWKLHWQKKKQKLLRSNQAKRKKLGDLYFIGFYLMKKYLYFIIIATILIKLLASKLLCLLFYAISDLVSQVEGNHP